MYDKPSYLPNGCPYVEQDTGVHVFAEYTKQLANWISAASDGVAGAIAAVARAEALVASAPVRVASGKDTVSITGATMTQLNVTYPSGRFTAPPKLFAAVTKYGARYVVRTYTTVSGGAIYLMTPGNTSVTESGIGIDWVAIQ